MARDVSIMVSARDNYTAVIEKMLKTQNQFKNDLKGLQGQLDTLNKNKVTLKVDLDKAKSELKEAQKNFSLVADEASRLQLEAAQANYDNIKQNLDAVTKAARDTQKEMNNLAGTSSKVQNQLTRGGEDSLLGALSKAGLMKMVGDSLSNTANVLIGSAFGNETGNLISSILGGTASGAALGSVAGPVGTAIGAGVGALAGAINGLTQTYQNQDEAYKSLVKDTFTEIMEGRSASLASGAATAGRREIDQISFATLFGNADKATVFLEEVRKMAAETPFGYDTLTNMSKVLSTYGYAAEQILPLLTKVGDAGSALGMSQEDMAFVATAIGRMNLTNKTTMEYLNPLIERGIPATTYLAQALGKSNEEVQDMVRKGLIPGAEAAKIIAEYMGYNFAGSMAQMSQTYEGLTSTIEDLNADMDAAMGQGYTETRKKGLEEQIAYMEGAAGEKLKNANYLIGVWQATLENQQEEALRKAYDEAFKYIEDNGITNEAEMGRILGEAQAKAKAAYISDPNGAYQTELAAQMTLVQNIQDALVDDYYNAGYSLGQKFSEGRAAAIARGASEDFAPSKGGSWYGSQGYYSIGGGHAFGLDRVPYDGFLTVLHEGERVLTAAEARRQDANGSMPQVTISGNTFVVREEADIERVAVALMEQFAQAAMSYTGSD